MLTQASTLELNLQTKRPVTFFENHITEDIFLEIDLILHSSLFIYFFYSHIFHISATSKHQQ